MPTSNITRRRRAELWNRTALYGVLAGALAGPALGQPSGIIAAQTSNGTTPSYAIAGTTGTVGLTAPRTIIDWRDFTIAGGETLTFNFQARSDIVLNRIDYVQARIDGTLNSFVGALPGGNVWISASNGVIFGPNSQVNVGGLLATTATLTDPNAFLDPTQTRFSFAFAGTGFVSGTAFPIGSGYGGVSVQAGARLQTSGGLLALIAPFVSVESGATIGGGATGDVLVGGANAYTVALQTETAGDLDMLEFVIDTPTDVDTPIAIQGSLAGRNVYVATLAPATLMNAVIVDTGSLAATRASNGTGGNIVLSSGADTISPDAQPTLSTGVTAAVAPVTFGRLTADNHAYIYSSGDLTQQAGAILGGGAATIGVGGNATVATVNLTGAFAFAPIPGAVVPQFTATGPITAGSVSVVRAGAIDVGNVTATTGDVTLQSLESTGQGYDTITAGQVVAQGSVDIEGRNVTADAVTAATGGATIRAVTPRTGRGATPFVDVGSISFVGPSVVQAQQGYASVGDVTFADPAGAGTLSVSAPAGTVYVGYAPGGAGTGGGSGAITGTGRLTLTARDDVDLDVQGAATVALATSQLGSVNLTANTLAAAQVTAAVDAALRANTGDLSATQVQAGGAVTLAAPAGAIQAGSLSGDSVTVTAAGSAQVGDATTQSTQDGRVRVTGSSVSITTAEPASDLIATATAGPAMVGDVTAGGNVTVGATGGAASLHSATFTTSGFTYTSGNPVGVLRMTATGAGGDVLLGSGSGFVTGASEIDLDAARDVAAQVQGPIRLTTVDAGRNAVLSAQDSATLGAGALTVDAVQATGDITATASGPLVLTDVTPGASLSATGASVTLGVLHNPPPIDLTIASTATGFTRTTPLSAGRNVTIGAAGPLALSDVTAGTGAVSLTGTTVDAGAVSANTAGTITATGGGITLASARVSSATGPLTLTAAGPIQANALQAGGAVTAKTTASDGAGGSSIDVGSLDAGTATLATGDGYVSVTDATVAPGGLLDIRAAGTAGSIYIGYAAGGTGAGGGSGALSGEATLLADADLAVDIQGAAAIRSAVAGGDATVVADSLALGSLSADAVGLTARTGTLAADTATARSDFTADAQAGAATIGTVTAGGDATVTADAVTLGSLDSDAITLTARTGALAVTSAAARGDFMADAQAGAATIGSVTAGGDATISADAVTLDSVSGDGVTLTARTGDLAVGTAIALADFSANASAGPASIGSVTAAGDATISADALTLGSVSGNGVTLTTRTGDLAVGSATALADFSANASAGAASIGSITAGGDATISADAVTLGSVSADVIGLTARTGPLAVESATARGAFVADAQAGPATIGSIAAGGDATVSADAVTLGSVSGNGITLTARTGDLAVDTAIARADFVADDRKGSARIGSVTAGGGATVTAQAVTANAVNAASVTLTGLSRDVAVGSATATGDFTASAPTGSISVSALTDSGATRVAAGQDLSLGVTATGGAGSVSAGRDLSVTGADAVNLGSAVLSAGRDATLASGGLFSLGSLNATRAARIVAGDLVLNGALIAPTVAIESASGPMTVGDGATGGGLSLSAAEFARIRASSSLSLYAGPTTGALRGDLTVGDLAVDPAAVPTLALYAASGHAVSVTGGLAPIATGGALTIGGSLTSGWRPTSVLVSGSLGAATYVSETQFTGVRAFDRVALNARGDILVGSSRFIDAVQGASPAAIDIAADRPGGLTATGAEIGRVSLVAGTLAVATDGKVVQQNTSGSPFVYSGTYLTGSPGSPGTVLTIDPPSVLDLFGSYVGADGRIATGRLAARGSELSVIQRAPGADYRFNGCEIGAFTACGVSEVIGPEQGLQLLDAQQAAVLATVTTRQRELTESTLLDDDPEAQAEDQLDPVVTGAGNEEIWRTRRKGTQ